MAMSKGAAREVGEAMLTCCACWLIVRNGNARKEQIFLDSYPLMHEKKEGISGTCLKSLALDVAMSGYVTTRSLSCACHYFTMTFLDTVLPSAVVIFTMFRPFWSVFTWRPSMV